MPRLARTTNGGKSKWLNTRSSSLRRREAQAQEQNPSAGFCQFQHQNTSLQPWCGIHHYSRYFRVVVTADPCGCHEAPVIFKLNPSANEVPDPLTPASKAWGSPFAALPVCGISRRPPSVQKWPAVSVETRNRFSESVSPCGPVRRRSAASGAPESRSRGFRFWIYATYTMTAAAACKTASVSCIHRMLL